MIPIPQGYLDGYDEDEGDIEIITPQTERLKRYQGYLTPRTELVIHKPSLM